MAVRDRFVFDVCGQEVKTAIGGKNFEMRVYDCVLKKFYTVLSIETEGPIVKVRVGEWSEDVLIYD